MNLIFAVLPIIVRPWISYLPFVQSSCIHGSPVSFFQSSSIHGSPICHYSIHCEPMDLVFAVLTIIVRPWISCLPFFQSSCTHGFRICRRPTFFQSSCVHGSPMCHSSNHRASTDLIFAVLPIIVHIIICNVDLPFAVTLSFNGQCYKTIHYLVFSSKNNFVEIFNIQYNLKNMPPPFPSLPWISQAAHCRHINNFNPILY